MKDYEKKNYYELLGVDRNASEEEIRANFKEIAIVYHPDSNFFSEIVPDLSQSAEDMKLFKTITNAYNTLVNKEKRAKYDATLDAQEKSQQMKESASGWQSTSTQSGSYQTSDFKKRPASSTDFGKVQPEALKSKRPKASEKKVQSVSEMFEGLRKERRRKLTRVIGILICMVLILVFSIVLVLKKST